jgi:hypothetical protein
MFLEALNFLIHIQDFRRETTRHLNEYKAAKLERISNHLFIYLFIYLFLFYLTMIFRNWDCVPSNEGVISEWQIVNGLRERGRGLI